MGEGIYPNLKMQGEARFTMGGAALLALSRSDTKSVQNEETEYDAMTISVGDKLPEVTLVKAGESGPEKVQTSDYFKGKKVALFSVPGAFTPTCSARHLPGYVEKADDLKAKGVDEIVATAVNDAFVMAAWKAAGDADPVTMLADGNGEFADAVGLTMDGSGFGLGKRGQRFSMIVDDGVVTTLNVEQPGDFSVSSAEHMLGQL